MDKNKDQITSGRMTERMEDTIHSTPSKANTDASRKKKDEKKMASIGETLSFVMGCGPRVKFLFALGLFAGILNGLVYPMLAYMFSTAFSDISAAQNEGLSQVRELAYTFLIIGTYALIWATVQGWCFATVAYHGSHAFRLQWFRALLRQDPAYFGKYFRTVTELENPASIQ